MVKVITIWQRWHQKKRRFVHNHIEDGVVCGVAPEPMSATQRASWRGAIWRALDGRLVDSVVHEVGGKVLNG